MRGIIRVLVVDDSAFMRRTLTKYLESDPEISVVGTAYDGEDALAKIAMLKPDVITLDVEMPNMDGLATLQRIMVNFPTPVIMVSSYTQSGARITIRALMRGAVDYVPKPSKSMEVHELQEELIDKVKIAAGTRRAIAKRPKRVVRSPAMKLGPRPFRKGDPVVVIGASAGGPRTLQELLSGLPVDFPAALLIVQHMRAGFTATLAQRLNEKSSFTVVEATEGDRLGRGLALLAPGDMHLRLRDLKRVTLDQGPRRNHVRPAVDVTMEAAVEYHGSAVIGIVLTGMGEDGTDGARCIKKAGGRVIAEHESTSLVYGMPRSVIEAGLADFVVPLPGIAETLVELVKHGTVGV